MGEVEGAAEIAGGGAVVIEAPVEFAEHGVE